MRSIRMLLLACTITTLATHSHAESERVSQWLMDQPVSRWDLGMMRVEQSAKRAVDRMKGEMSSDSFGHVVYSEEKDEIDIWVRIVDFWGDPTHEKCNEFRNTFLSFLGSYNYGETEESKRRFVYQAIGWWFFPMGYLRAKRDDDFPEKLSQMIFVTMRVQQSMQIAKTPPEITCRDRITVFEAPSQPG